MEFLKTRIGYILPITSNVGLKELKCQRGPFCKNLNIPISNLEVSRETIYQISCYFSGTLTKFSLPLDFSDWSSQMRRWFSTLSQIPYGKTISYRELAYRWGNKNASRAAGQACKRNPIPIIIPCHRVVNSDDKIKNYGLGNVKDSTSKGNISKKLLLINLEKQTSNYSCVQKNLH